MKHNLRIKLIGSLAIFSCAIYFWVDGEVYSSFGLMVASLLLILPEFLRKRWPRFPSIMMVLAFFISTVSGGFFFHAKNVKDSIDSRGGDVILEKTDHVSEKTHKIGDRENPDASASGTDTSKASQPLTVQESMRSFFTTEERNNPEFQKMMEIASSEEFHQFLSQSDEPLTMGELASFFVSQGMTEWEGIDFDNLLNEGYEALQKDYIAGNNGNVPETEDNVRAQHLSELITRFGKTQGLAEFAKNDENLEWIAARFKGDQKAFNQWLHAAIYPLPLPAEYPVSPLPSASVEEKTSDIVHYQKEENAPPDVIEITPSQLPQEFDDAIEDKKVDTPTVSFPLILTKEITDGRLEPLLSENFSPERTTRALAILNQYGPENGLRRLQESDPKMSDYIKVFLEKQRLGEETK